MTPPEFEGPTHPCPRCGKIVGGFAFGGGVEAHLVELVRKRGKALVSLVATTGGRIVGHIMFSPVTIAQAPENVRSAGLGPLAVLPEFQNRRIGSQLVADRLEACRRAAQDIVVVLGHPTYYPRFGFSRGNDHGLESEYNAPNAFMVMELTPGVFHEIAGGVVRYGSEFRESGY
jgi:putative acetyltransferase